MSQEDLFKFAEGVLLLHKKLSKCVISNSLFEELNLQLHSMMDKVLRSCSTKHFSDLTKNNVSEAKGKIQKQKKKNRRLSQTLVSDSRVIDKQIKRCSVILQRISDHDLKKYLPANSKPKLSKSELRVDLKSVKMSSDTAINMEPELDVESYLDLDPKLLATEDHLDLLMAQQMITTNNQIKQRQIMNNVVNNANHVKKNYKDMNSGNKNPDKINSGSVNHMNINPVVMLNRLSSQFIASAVNGKYRKECNDEIPEVVKRRIYTKRRIAVGFVRRRSQRSSVLKSSCSCCSGSTLSLGNESYSNEENRTKLKKKVSIKNNKKSYSSDDEDFYGFESQDKNNLRTNKFKKALEKQCKATEKELIIMKREAKKKEIMKKENEKYGILKMDIKKYLTHKAPLKVLNRVETINGVSKNISIFKDERAQRKPRVRRGFNSNAVESDFEVELFTRDENEAEAAGIELPADKLEILKLFQQRKESKELINRLAKDKGKSIKTKRKSLDCDILITSEMDYTSDECYLNKGKKRVPVWAEEGIREAIMSCQEEIPHSLITEYFRTPQTLSVGRLFPHKCF